MCEKLNGDNYEIWYHKVRYVSEEQEVLETLSHVMEELEKGTSAQHSRDQKAYVVWKKKNALARITLLSFMEDDLLIKYEVYKTAHKMWESLKEKYGGLLESKFRCLLITKHIMKQHLREMKRMIRELKTSGHVLTDELSDLCPKVRNIWW